MPSPRYFHSSVVYGDCLYLFGGYNGTERLQDLYEFNFKKSRWEQIEALLAPSGRSSLVAQVYSNSMYIFGGYNGSVVLNDFHEFKFDLISVPQSSLISDLRRMIDDPVFTDVCFVVEGRQIRANRAVVAARSDHFRAMFYGGMREASEATIVIEDITYPVFLAVLEFLYTDSVPEISAQQAVELMIAAELFLLDRLKALCQELIRRYISIDNVVSMLRTSHYHFAHSLKEICVEFICARYDEVKHSAGFKELVGEPELMMELLMRLR